MRTSDPDHDCPYCPRLREFIISQRVEHPQWFNGPVPSFGDDKAQLLICGLAPGLRGANKSGRPFTGDYAGDLLYETIAAYGFSKGRFDARADDGLELKNCMVTNAVRCVPPQNKPVTAEIRQCNKFLSRQIKALTRLKVIMALGTIAHNAVLMALDEKRSAHKFGHGAVHELGDLVLIDSYHCSRYNTNTRRLTPEMFRDVFDIIADRMKNATA